MDAEPTTRTVSAHNCDGAVPSVYRPVSTNILASRVIPDSFAIPAYIWCMLVAITSDMIGGYWDVAWHSSIGRDTFWTPAHLAIQLGGVLGGFTAGFLILSTTLGHNPAALERKAVSVKIWGFRGPLGAFLAAWGGFAMITSAPFDNWWHNAYGLDVTIISPPHVLLMSGSLAIDIGTLILIDGAMNRSHGHLRAKFRRLFLYVGGVIVMHGCFLVTEYTGKEALHSTTAYLVISLSVPLTLVGVARASEHRWGNIIVAAIYTAAVLAQLWVLPLFAAQPKLGPVYQNVTHFIPMAFPLLLIVPGLALDLLWRATSAWRPWLQAASAGMVFLVSFISLQWPFATFLMSPLARNRIFGAHYFGYNDPAGFLYDPDKFQASENTRVGFWIVMIAALLAAILTTRLGSIWAKWMKEVRR